VCVGGCVEADGVCMCVSVPVSVSVSLSMHECVLMRV